DGLLEHIRKEKGYFSQCVIDEAHCMSEWSHDPRPVLMRAPAFSIDRLEAGKKKYVAVRLLTASVSRDVITDLRWQLSALGRAWSLDDEQCVVDTHILQPQQQFQLVTLPIRAKETAAVLAARQQAVPDTLQTQRDAFLERHDQASAALRVPGYSAAAMLPTVVYCPYPSGTLGVTNRYAAGVTDAAVDETLLTAQYKIGIFVGKDDGGSLVGRYGIADAIEQCAAFRRGTTDLLISTRAYGVGTQKPDIRCTLHLLPPPGVERLVQECGRGGRDGRLSLHTILFGGPAQKGDSLDFRLGAKILTDAASDAAREKQLLHDLMKEISFPEDSNTNRVSTLIADEFGIEVRISYWQRGLDERMYAQHEGSVLGYIDLVSHEIVPDSGYPQQRFGRDILEYAYAASLGGAGSGPSLSSWVAATFAADVEDGIARQMQDFDPDAVFTLRVGYENDREPLLNQIHQLLWRQAEIEIQRKVFSDVHGRSWQEFREQLLLRVGRPDLFTSLDPEIEEQLIRIYNKIRTRSDTERILSRLAALGVVHDYKAHPASRKYSVRVAVRADHEIRTALEQYIGLFLTARQTERRLAALQSYPGDTQLERCLYLLIDFSYEYCDQRHIESARMMDTLCRAAMVNDNGNFRDNIEKALNAKYALSSMLPAALGQVTSRIELLAHYMKVIEEDRSASVRENAAQLHASCALLLSSYPDEPVIPLLNTFVELVNAQKSDAQKSVFEEFAAAFGRSASASGLEEERYLAAVSDFHSRLGRFFDDTAVESILSHLHGQVRRVKSHPLPAAVPLETRAAQQRAAEQRAAEQRATEQRATEQRVAEQRVAEQRVAEQRAAEQRAAEQRAVEQRAAEQRVAEQRAAEQRVAEQRVAEQRAAEQRVAEQNAEEQRAVQAHAAVPDHVAVPDHDAVPVHTPAPPPVDPILLKHLKWLQTFNHSFLKHYES
ncbi:MAG: helicase-related protein, partial [Bacteroidota bacterium]